MSKSTDAARTIEDTRWYLLDPTFWIKNQERIGERMCLIGAIRRANGPGQLEAERVVLARVGKRGYHSIPSFNDSPTTTHAMIIEVLDEALKEVAT